MSEAPTPAAPAATEKPKKKKKKRLLGFAGIVWNNFKILNGSDYFKEKYGEDDFSVILVATDDRRAALLTFKDGTMVCDAVKNKPEEIKPAIKKADGMIKASLVTFMNFLMGKINPVKAVLTGKLKIKGVKTILHFTGYFKVISYLKKQEKIAAQEKSTTA